MEHPLKDLIISEVEKKVKQLEQEIQQRDEKLKQYEELVAVFDKQLCKLIYLGYEEDDLKLLYTINRGRAVEIHLERYKRKVSSLLAMIRLVRTSK
jgi:hypothetical protein